MLDFKARDAERVGQDLEQLVGDLHNTGRAETPGEIDMLKSPSCLVWAVVLFLLCSPSWSLAVEADTGRTIIGADLSPGGKRLCLRFTGLVGKHAAFVLEKPYRLVVDFLDASLGRVAKRIPGDLPLKEVRMGQHGTRARIVADFGSNPVPPFKITRVGDRVFVVFEVGAVTPEARQEISNSHVPPRKRSGSRSSAVARRTAHGGPLSSVVVTGAGVKGDLISFELASAITGRSRYKVVLQCDLQDLLVRSATLSDASGRVKRFDFVKAGSSKTSSEARVATTKAPTKGDVTERGTLAPDRKFKWGLPTASRPDPMSTRDKRGPFRLERYQLKARQVADQR